MKVLTDKNNRMFFSQYKLTQNEEFEITRGQRIYGAGYNLTNLNK